MKVPFSKLSGCGNDFILIDNRDRTIPDASPTWFTQLCNRRHGIGADGVIWLEQASHNTAHVRIYNADGSEAESCGNAFRCIFTYLKNKDTNLVNSTITTPFTSAKVQAQGTLVQTYLEDPSSIEWDLSVTHEGQTWQGHFLNTGVPHAVFVVEDLDALDVAKIGKALRFHPRFGPRGANINFVSIQDKNLRIRTYERGVEAETHACATGSAAVGITASQKFGFTAPISIVTYSGETLTVDFSTESPNQFHHVSLLGPATLVYEGHIEIGK